MKTLLLAALLPLTVAAAPKQKVTIAAAANLQAALEQLITRYQATHPDIDLQATYGALGAFFAQLKSGAPFDLFLAADVEFPKKVVAVGLASGPVTLYAVGSLVLWVPSSSTLELDKKGLDVLLDPSVIKVAIGNPAVAPYGVAAEQAMRAAGVYDRVKSKLVLGQSVSQAAQFVHSGNAQAGFLPLSLALTPPLSTDGRFVRIPPSLFTRIEQAGVVLKSSRSQAAADFLHFIVSSDGRAILEKCGYSLPD